MASTSRVVGEAFGERFANSEVVGERHGSSRVAFKAAHFVSVCRGHRNKYNGIMLLVYKKLQNDSLIIKCQKRRGESFFYLVEEILTISHDHVFLLYSLFLV